MAENLSDLMTQLEPDPEGGSGEENELRHPRSFRSITAFHQHLSTKFGLPQTTSIPHTIARSVSADGETTSSEEPSPHALLSSFSLPIPSPISPLRDAGEDFFFSPLPPLPPLPFCSPPKRRRNEMSPTPPVSPTHSASNSSRPTPPPSPTHTAAATTTPQSLLERCIEAYNSNPDAFPSYSAWEFYNPQLKDFTFHQPTIQLKLNELTKNETLKVWEREMYAVRLINDAGFAQVHQQLGDNYYQMVYDPEKNEMAFVPIKVGPLRNLLSQLFYKPLGPKRPETTDFDDAPEAGNKKAITLNKTTMGKVWPASVFKKQFTGVVFWPYAPPGEVVVTEEKLLEKFEGIRYEFLRANGEGNSKKEATRRLTYPPQLFYNLWRGFRYYSHPIHHLPTFNISTATLVLDRLQDYLLNIICNGNKIHYDYFSRWMGFIRQNPGEKTGVVPIMIGYEGAGKSLWASEVLVKCFGPHGITLANWTDLLHKFGGDMLEKAILVAAEEVDFSDEKMVDIYKSMVTGEFSRVEKKGHPIYQVRNKLNFILSTNKDKFGNVGKKGARRWFVLYVSDKYANKDPSSLAFFQLFLRMLSENDSFGLRVFDFWLREMDLEGFRPQTVPTTEALNQNIQAFMDPIENWWLDKIREQQHVDVNPDDALTAKTNGQDILQEVHPKAARSGRSSYWGWLQWPVSFSLLHKNFLESKFGKGNHSVQETDFVNRLRTMLPIGTILNPGQQCCHLPPFSECQERAFKLFGIKEALFDPTKPKHYTNPIPDPSRLHQTTMRNFVIPIPKQ